MKKVIRGILAAVLSLSMILTTALAGSAESGEGAGGAGESTDVTAPDSPTVEMPEPSESHITLPVGMRAVFVSPETDFTLDEEGITALCGNIADLGMNTLVIRSTVDETDYYSLDLEKEDILQTAVSTAHNNGLAVYITLDVNSLLSQVINQGGGLKSGFSAAAHKFAMKYDCEGIILTNYYTPDNEDMYAEYLRCGSGIGYDNWLYETNRFVMRSLSEVIHKTSNSTAVGFLIDDVWANDTDDPDGSETQDSVQALYDGHCDLKKYLEEHYADMIIVRAYGSTSDSDLNFENVVSWWNDLSNSNNVRTYVCHMNERIGEYSGWNEDQLLQQLTIMKKMGGSIGGSCFNSLEALNSNVLSSTDTLKKFFADEINTETVFDELIMTSPSALSFTTYDPTVKFMGTFDENFDVYFDGEKIQLNEAGNFLIRQDLNVGMNYFTIEHKGKKYSYSIERTVNVMTSADSIGEITVEGGTQLSFSAVAYSGSTVYASIGGQTIQLTEKSSSEQVDANGNYSEYVGYYTVGGGIVGQEQYLGEVYYYASYMGYEKSAYGGSVTIAAKPELPKKPIEVEIIPDAEQSELGTGEVVGTMDPYYNDDEYVTFVKVLNDFTDVLDPMTTGHIPSPQFSQMPAGTLDYLKSSSDDYVITTSGKRYRSEYVTTFDDTGLGCNALCVDAIGDSGGSSYIELSLDYKTSFNVKTSQSYYNAYEGPYGVRDFNAQYIYITFDNVTSITKLPDFSSCTLFSAGEWSTVEEDGIPKFMLTLTLRQAGIYSGVDAYYDDSGELVLSFNIPTATLSGKTIVISPGHGVNENGFDPGAIGQVTEQSINLKVAKALADELEAMGANVVRFKTETEFIYDRDRPKVARQYGADMFLEIHCNSNTSTSAHGCEVYYFTPFSQPLASAINNNLAAFLDSAYGDGTSSSRGDMYSYYWYTLEQGFPSVLVEMGFVSNDKECMLMNNNPEGLAEAIAEGVWEYFARSSL